MTDLNESDGQCDADGVAPPEVHIARERIYRKATGTPTTARPTPLDEITDAIGAEIAHCAARAAELASLLESSGAQAFFVAGEVFRAADPTELLRRAHAMRGVVLHALTVLAELQNVAGRLGVLATLRGVARERSDRPGDRAV